MDVDLDLFQMTSDFELVKPTFTLKAMKHIWVVWETDPTWGVGARTHLYHLFSEHVS